MPNFSLVPVDHQPDFRDVSLIPVDHDPFSADDMVQQARTQLATQPARLATGADLPDVGAPAIGDGGQFSAGTAIGNKAADVAGKVAYGLMNQFATLPQRAIDASAQDMQHLGEEGYTQQAIGPALETAMMMTGAGAPMAESGAVGALGGKLSRFGTTTSPKILPEELAGQTRSQIRDLAVDKGLVPKGDPLDPDYPRRWSDPVTNERRLQLDRGHVDSETGQPYSILNAAVDHVHAYDINGKSIKIDGDNHIPTTGE